MKAADPLSLHYAQLAQFLLSPLQSCLSKVGSNYHLHLAVNKMSFKKLTDYRPWNSCSWMTIFQEKATFSPHAPEPQPSGCPLALLTFSSRYPKPSWSWSLLFLWAHSTLLRSRALRAKEDDMLSRLTRVLCEAAKTGRTRLVAKSEGLWAFWLRSIPSFPKGSAE